MSLCACKSDFSKSQASSDTTKEEVEAGFSRKIASTMDDKSGWLYQFFYEELKDEPDERYYAFQGINLRYRYDDDYWSVALQWIRDKDGAKIYLKNINKTGILLYGEGGDAQKADLKTIVKILDNSRDPQELLNENPGDYTFETIDRDMFFSLLRNALTGDYVPDTASQLYWDKPSWAMLVEPEYLDGYKFQIGFVMKSAEIDEIYIDVLYQTGPEYNNYIQLSDLVDAKQSTSEQEKAFELIQTIRRIIKEAGVFNAGSERYKELSIAGIDFVRLYTFLNNIHNNNHYSYNNSSEHPPAFSQEISFEEFESLGGKVEENVRSVPDQNP